jgi:hypothetical protein
MSNINTTIAAAFTKFIKADDKAREAIKAARAALLESLMTNGVTTRDAAEPYAIAWAAKAYGNGEPNDLLKDGEGKAKGKRILDKDHANYETARKAKGRVLAVFETADKPAEKAEAAPTVTPATEAEKALFAAFVATCGSVARAKAVFKALAA